MWWKINLVQTLNGTILYKLIIVLEEEVSEKMIEADIQKFNTTVHFSD